MRRRRPEKSRGFARAEVGIGKDGEVPVDESEARAPHLACLRIAAFIMIMFALL